MQHWLDLGVDGLRLDAIPYLCVRDGTSNENLPETHAVVKRFRRAIDAKYRNRMLLAEANQWPEDVREYFGDGDECHMAYHFPLMPRMYMAIAQEDRYPIVEILQQTPDIPPTCQWAIFLRNHDELTLEMVTDRERDYMYQMYAADPRARVNVGIRRRLAPLMENDPAKIQLMNSLLFSMPGSPTVYYGDELGMGDNIYLGDRNGVRTPMQWSPDRNGGFSRADPQGLFLPPIMDPIYGYASVNVEAQSREPSSLLNWTRRMLAVRKTCKAFGRGTFELLRPGNRTILAYLRRYENQAILCVANLKRSAQAVELDLAPFRGRVPVEMIGRSSFPPIGDLPYMLTLPGYAFYWFDLAESAPPPSWHEERLPADERPWLVLFNGLDSFDGSGESRQGAATKLLAQLEREVVPSYLAAQRWFAGKGQGAPAVTITDIGRWQPKQEAWLLTVAAAQFPADARAGVLPAGRARMGRRARGPARCARARARAPARRNRAASSMLSPTTTSCAPSSARSPTLVGAHRLRHAALYADQRARGARAEAPRAGARAPCRREQQPELRGRRAAIPEGLPPPAPRRASRMGGRPLPHRALAVRRRRADGRRNRARAALDRADDCRTRASRRAEPRRRLALYVALPRAQHRRCGGPRGERRDRPRGPRSYLLLVHALAARTAELHRALAVPHRRPGLRSRAAHGRARRRMGQPRSAASSTPRCSALREPARRAPRRRARCRDARARVRGTVCTP